MNTHDAKPSLTLSPGLPKSREGEPAFAEPWQAEAFAMTVHLHEKGVFSWSEWAEVLSQELYRPGRRADASDYYDCWVAALSRLVTELSITSAAQLDGLTKQWQQAAEATPHGQPIRLENAAKR
ncbi:nitrile hydratase accessory protein [Rhizobium sp. 32-5/1]|uniref:nitrile hydratase accessory protein n=1 Tax=Rhizobium sp. 32-5/1 TaxID=3019602 RepID=UPI00240E51DA|nr:nitrile hydratase accessory protein [Rhizobium sp. 32-5/1]WEZ83131.1 nitrile hydratase accessory protein [Rhizobium sp. 32-5/1]